MFIYMYVWWELPQRADDTVEKANSVSEAIHRRPGVLNSLWYGKGTSQEPLD